MGIAASIRRYLTRSIPPPILSASAAYAIWAESYVARPHNEFMVVEQGAILEILPDLAGRSVLDLACGSGRYGQIAIQRGAKNVVGMDNSAPMLRTAAGFPTVRGEMTALPFANAAFDVVLCGLATGHLKPHLLPRAIAEMSRVTKTDGMALLSDLHPYIYLQNGGLRTFTAKDGRTFNVEHYPHLVSDYFSALDACGFTLSSIREKTTVVDGKNVPAVLAIAARRKASF